MLLWKTWFWMPNLYRVGEYIEKMAMKVVKKSLEGKNFVKIK